MWKVKDKKRFRIGVGMTVLFLLFITFLAPDNIVKSIRLRHNINRMEKERRHYREMAQKDSAFIENLKDDRFLEKYARETYYMKHRSEEIYLIEE